MEARSQERYRKTRLVLARGCCVRGNAGVTVIDMSDKTRLGVEVDVRRLVHALQVGLAIRPAAGFNARQQARATNSHHVAAESIGSRYKRMSRFPVGLCETSELARCSKHIDQRSTKQRQRLKCTSCRRDSIAHAAMPPSHLQKKKAGSARHA
eukprot:5755172-Pleurochrysis_carterae.AAC.1